MAIICPTVTAYDLHEYREQMERASKLADRVHVDLMDGLFAPVVSPEIARIWLPFDKQIDIHLMYQKPMDQLERLIKLRPNMVIIQAEADAHHMHFVAELHKADIKAGLSILQNTSVASVEQIIHSFDHVLVFSGNLGYHGGQADLALLSKVHEIRKHHPDTEISWDGGINDQNAKQLAEAGVDVLNVGGFIQKANEPEIAYQQIRDSLL